MTRKSLLATGLLLLASPLAARAQPAPTPPPPPAGSTGNQPPRPPPRPVKAGTTTVTVIDEGESIDDVISRVRAGKPGSDERARSNPGGGTPDPARTPPPRTPAEGRERKVAPGTAGELRDRVRERLRERKDARKRERRERLRTR
jgi:hypothetical protein